MKHRLGITATVVLPAIIAVIIISLIAAHHANAQSVGVFVATGQQAVTGTATNLPSQAANVLCVKAVPGNLVPVYIGGSNVTTSNGYPLASSESACFPIINANRLYVVATSTGSSIAWFATSNSGSAASGN